MNSDTPRVYTNEGEISIELAFGISTKFFTPETLQDIEHIEEVETLQFEQISDQPEPFIREDLEMQLQKLPKDVVYRIKGFIYTQDSNHKKRLQILNWAFGHGEFIDCSIQNPQLRLKVTVMGSDLSAWKHQIAAIFSNK